MKVKIENPRFSYAGNNITSASSEVVIYEDDGTTELYRKGLTAKANLSDSATDATGNLLWQVNAENALAQQAQEIIDKYKVMMQAVTAAWSTASTPDEALSLLASEVEAKLTY